jgi:hypothetical protein
MVCDNSLVPWPQDIATFHCVLPSAFRNVFLVDGSSRKEASGRLHASHYHTGMSVTCLVCKFLFPKATRGFEPISYSGALLSTLLHATVYMFLHNLLNVLVQMANKNGITKKNRSYQTSADGRLPYLVVCLENSYSPPSS